MVILRDTRDGAMETLMGRSEGWSMNWAQARATRSALEGVRLEHAGCG